VYAGAAPDHGGQAQHPGWEVAATTNAIIELAEQLAGQGIERMVVESTSEDWRGFVYLLEARGLCVWPATPEQVPGRPKTDKLDAVWLAKLNERGMLRPSFIPPAEIRQVREDTRLRSDLTQERSRHVQRLEKLLEDALIKLSTVATDIMGASGRDMIEALIAGQRDPKVLAELARGRLRGKRAALVQALTGRSGDHHAELARMLLDQIDALGVQTDRLTSRIEELIGAIPAAQPPRTRLGTPASAPTSRRRRAGCRRSIAWTRSPASASRPPRCSSPRSGWTWVSSLRPRTWCRGPGCHPAPSSPAPPGAPAPPARATPT
jgi:Transposase